MPNEIRGEIENNIAAQDAEKYGKLDIFKYYIMTGKDLSPDDAKRGSIDDETAERFNAALAFKRNTGATSLKQDIQQGLKNEGLGGDVEMFNGEEQIVVQ